MPYSIEFATDARNDLRAIHAYIAENDTKENADYVAREVVRTSLTLGELPDRGAHPPALLALGNRSYRQIFLKPYQILYRINGNTIIVVLIADGRRNMTRLLTRRLAQS